MANISLVWAAVDETLRLSSVSKKLVFYNKKCLRGRGTYIVDIAVVAIATQGDRVARVVKAEEVQTTLAGLVARSDTHGDAVLKLLVNDNVVSAAKRHGRVVVTRQVLGIVKLDGGLFGLDAQKLQSRSVSFPARMEPNSKYLGHVKDLDTIAFKLAANDDIMLVRTDLGPVRAISNRSKLWPVHTSGKQHLPPSTSGMIALQKTEMKHPTLGENFDEGHAVVQAAG